MTKLNKTSSNYSILSNREALNEKQKKVVDAIKIDLLDVLDMDNKLVNRNELAHRIRENREKSNNDLPVGDIKLRDGHSKNIEKGFGEVLNQYQSAQTNEDKQKLDTELAERMILDSGLAIEFKSSDNFSDGKNARIESELAFDGLNKVKKYENKIDLISNGNTDDFFLIQWKPSELKKIELALKTINIIESENENDDEKSKKIEEMEKQIEEKDTKIEELEGLIKKLHQKETSEDDPESVSEDTPKSVSEDTIESVSEDDLVLFEQREWLATISNTTRINRALSEREADEELREKYKRTSWYNPIGKMNLFLRRQFMKNKIVNERMGLDGFKRDSMNTNAAARHQIESAMGLNNSIQLAIQDINSTNYPETRRRLDNLVNRFTGGPLDWMPSISETHFQNEFETILNQSGKIFDTNPPAPYKPISEIIRTNDMRHLSTNILMQAKQFVSHQKMTWRIAERILTHSGESDANFDKFFRGEVNKYTSTYNNIPDFLQQTGISLDSVNAAKDIKRLQKNSAALSVISKESLKLRIQLLDDGKEAYDVERRRGLLTDIGRFLDDPTGGDETKIGRWFEKHPRLKGSVSFIRGLTKLGVMITPALLLAPMGPIAVAGGAGGMAFLTTMFKKKSHYEKEHRSYQKEQANNVSLYSAERQRLANEVSGMKWYEGRLWGEKRRIRKQFDDYVQTTHNQIVSSDTLKTNINNVLSLGRVLSDTEKLNLGADLSNVLARLDYHNQTGQNFLGSNNPNESEKEYRELQNILLGGAQRLGLLDVAGNVDLDQIRNHPPLDMHYNYALNLIKGGTGRAYDNQGYKRANSRYRRWNNIKTGVGALKAGAVAAGLSYLFSSLSSGTKTETVTTETEHSIGQVGGEHNLAGFRENLMVTGDIDGPMKSVLTPDVSEVHSLNLYSAVDAAKYNNIATVTKDLATVKSEVASMLNNSAMASNPDVISAVNNFISTDLGNIATEAASKGADAGNQVLAQLRALETLKEGFLQPILDNGLSSVKMPLDAIVWSDGGIQASGSGVVGQSMRNMGFVGMEYMSKSTENVVSKVTRAIPITAGMNTFGDTRPQRGAVGVNTP